MKRRNICSSIVIINEMIQNIYKTSFHFVTDGNTLKGVNSVTFLHCSSARSQALIGLHCMV